MSSTTETLSDINHLLATHAALTNRIRADQRAHRAILRTLPSPPAALLDLPLIPTPSPSPPPSPTELPSRTSCLTSPERDPKTRVDLPMDKRVRLARYNTYVPEEETLRNDYSQRYVDSGEWPQNAVLGADWEQRFEEYPKQQRLLHLKRLAVEAASLPPHYLPLSLLHTMPPSKFDVILIDPPYHSPSFSWDTLQKLPIAQLASEPSFVFMWVGSGAGEGLEKGREVMSLWGYRRCEDVVWVKTNRTSNQGPGTDPPTSSLLTRTKQHCLIGIRGTVRRSTDNWFVHCNIDTDVIIWEGDPEDPTRKPPEIYALIESFCLGARRLEIFGRRRAQHPLRRGWVTVLLPENGDMSAAAVGPVGTSQVLDVDDGEGARDSRASSVGGDEVDMAVVTADPAAAFAEEDTQQQRQDPPLEGLEDAVLWQRDKWQKDVREKCGLAGIGVPFVGRVVVPTTPEIDALRPKSPVRGGSSNHHFQNHQHNNHGAPSLVSHHHHGMPMHINLTRGVGPTMNMVMAGMDPNSGMSMNMMNATPMQQQQHRQHQHLPMRPVASSPSSLSLSAVLGGGTVSSSVAPSVSNTPMMRLGPGVMQNQMMGMGGMTNMPPGMNMASLNMGHPMGHLAGGGMAGMGGGMNHPGMMMGHPMGGMGMGMPMTMGMMGMGMGMGGMGMGGMGMGMMGTGDQAAQGQGHGQGYPPPQGQGPPQFGAWNGGY